jgi:hypothetical protein
MLVLINADINVKELEIKAVNPTAINIYSPKSFLFS